MRVLAGVDGCKGGWVAAVRAAPSEPIRLSVHAAFADLVETLGPTATIAVDMPIGLPERIDGSGRVAERAVRGLLRGRQSSVFSIPGRAVVESIPPMFHDELHRRESHRAASDLARTLSTPPRGVSIQGYMLFRKILEIDVLLRASPALAERIVESHPELAFAILNDGEPMALPKKVKNCAHPAGLAERRALLATHGVPERAMAPPLPAGAGADDVLDALAMLLVAERVADGRARPFPDPPGRDAHGLPIAIWA